jgi:hypothetical protein
MALHIPGWVYKSCARCPPPRGTAQREPALELTRRPIRPDVLTGGHERHRNASVGQLPEQHRFVSPINERRAQRLVHRCIPRDDQAVFEVTTGRADLRPGAILVQPVSSDADDRLHALGVVQGVAHGQVRPERVTEHRPIMHAYRGSDRFEIGHCLGEARGPPPERPTPLGSGNHARVLSGTKASCSR